MIFDKEHIYLNKHFKKQKDALSFIAEEMKKHGFVKGDYLPYMLEREELAPTYIGNEVAIPHGTQNGQDLITKTGLIFVQVPEGVDFKDNTAKILIGIASKSSEHMDILSKLALVLSVEENVNRMLQVKNPEEILQIMNGENI